MEVDQVLFEMPVEMELRKSQGESTPRRILRGYASTESRDQDGETVLQHGMDFSPLLKSGFMNYDHMGKCLRCGMVHGRAKCPECLSKSGKMPIIIGYPISAEIRDKGWFLESELFNGAGAEGTTSDQLRLADEMWAIGMAMQKSRARSLAYSVEGGVLQRQGPVGTPGWKKVSKSVVRNCAVTHKPVNEESSVELFMKSLCCGRCSKDHPLHIPGHSCGDHGAEAIQKAMSTEAGTAMANGNSPLNLQNLDHRMTAVLYGGGSCDCCEPSGKFKGGLIGAVEHLKKCQGYSQDQSVAFLRKIIHNAPKNPDLSELVAKAGLTGK